MTNVLVAFATRGGTTQSIAERLGARLTEAGHQATVVSVQDNPDPAAYEAVIVGSGIIGDSVYSSGGRWVTAHRTGLEGKHVAVFVVCLSALSDDPDRAAQAADYPGQLTSALPQDSVGEVLFPGTYDPATRRWWERAAARLTRAPKGDFRDWDKVDAWAEHLATLL